MKNKESIKKILKRVFEQTDDNNASLIYLGLHELRLQLQDLSKNEANSLLFKYSVSKKQDLDTFQDLYDKILDKRKRDSYEIIIPLSFTIPRRRFSFLGQNYKVLKKFKEEKRGSIKSFLVTKVTGNSIEDSWMEVSNNVYTLIGILTHIQFNFRYGWTEHFEERRKINFPTKIYSKSTRQESLELAYDFKSTKNITEFDSKKIARFNKMLRKYRTVPLRNSIDSLLLGSFLVYGYSMNSVSVYSSYLNFWQIIELLTLSEEFGGQTNKIVNRIRWLIEEKLDEPNIAEFTLKSIAEKRNDLVHRGIVEIDQEDSNILKFICDFLIDWLSKSKDIKDKNTLRYFYSLRSKNNQDLLLTKKVANQIIRERK